MLVGIFLAKILKRNLYTHVLYINNIYYIFKFETWSNRVCLCFVIGNPFFLLFDQCNVVWLKYKWNTRLNSLHHMSNINLYCITRNIRWYFFRGFEDADAYACTNIRGSGPDYTSLSLYITFTLVFIFAVRGWPRK